MPQKRVTEIEPTLTFEINWKFRSLWLARVLYYVFCGPDIELCVSVEVSQILINVVHMRLQQGENLAEVLQQTRLRRRNIQNNQVCWKSPWQKGPKFQSRSVCKCSVLDKLILSSFFGSATFAIFPKIWLVCVMYRVLRLIWTKFWGTACKSGDISLEKQDFYFCSKVSGIQSTHRFHSRVPRGWN